MELTTSLDETKDYVRHSDVLTVLSTGSPSRVREKSTEQAHVDSKRGPAFDSAIGEKRE